MKQSIQSAQYIKKEQTTVGAQAIPAINVYYTRLDGEKPQELSVRYLVGKLDEASRAILGTLKKGDKFVVVKEEAPNAKDPAHPFWNLKEFRAADTFVAKPKSTWTGNKSNSEKTPFDNIGVKIGAARNQAIAILGTALDNGLTLQGYLDKLDALAYDIVKRQAVMEENVRKGITPLTDHMEEALANEQHNRDLADSDDEIAF